MAKLGHNMSQTTVSVVTDYCNILQPASWPRFEPRTYRIYEVVLAT